jgi:hypothetical protein
LRFFKKILVLSRGIKKLSSVLSFEQTLNATIEAVAARKDAWATLPAADKLQILLDIKRLLAENAQEWIRLDCEQHKYDMNNPAHAHLVGEIHFVGPSMLGCWLHGMIQTYTTLRDTGSMPKLTTTKRPSGGVAAKVFPLSTKETIFAGGQTYELFVKPGAEFEQKSPLTHPAGIEAILGAGNFQAQTDILTVLFLENKVSERNFVSACPPLPNKN